MRLQPRHLLPFTLGLLLASGAVGPQACRCGTVGDEESAAGPAAVALPDEFPRHARDTAPSLAAKLPADVDFAVFLSSYAAFIDLVDVLKGWGIFEPEQLEGIFASLERHHGINPGKPASYLNDGLGLEDGAVIGMTGGNWFAVVRVRNRDRFEAFLDTFINEEFGRPRPREAEHAGVAVQNIFVLKKDLASIAFVDDQAVLVAGERFGGGPSLAALGHLLEVRSAAAGAEAPANLASSPGFQRILEQLGDKGPLLVYTPGGVQAKAALAPFLGDDERIKKLAETALGEVIIASGAALALDAASLTFSTFVAMPEDNAKILLDVVAPQQAGGNLARLVHPDATGVARLSFAPAAVEKGALAFAGEAATLRWEKIKSAASVRFVMSFEDDVLYNLSGQVVATLFSFDEDKLGATAEVLDMLEGIDAAVFLTFADAGRASGYFGKISTLKGLLPKGEVEVEERDGVLIATIRQRRRVVLRVAYFDGVLAACSGESTIARVVDRLKSQETAQAATARLEPSVQAIVGGGVVWGVSVDMAQVIALLSARFDIVRVQIARFLSPLSRASLALKFQPDGVALSFVLDRQRESP